jgi:hypothetical protein
MCVHHIDTFTKKNVSQKRHHKEHCRERVLDARKRERMKRELEARE